jgi:hypothetical protein
VRERAREERPPIMELNDIRPKEPDEREEEAATSALVESVLETARSRPLKSVCCLVSTVEEDHLEKRGVVGREDAGEEFSETELVWDVETSGGCWGDVEEGRLATEEERERVA